MESNTDRDDNLLYVKSNVSEQLSAIKRNSAYVGESSMEVQ